MDFKLAITVQKRELGVTAGGSVGSSQFAANSGQKDTRLCQVSEIWGLQVHNNTSSIWDRSDRSFINRDHREKTSGQHPPLCSPVLCQVIAETQRLCHYT